MVPLCVMAPTCGNLSLGRGPPAGVGVACVPGGRPPGGDCMIGKDVPLRDMVEALELAYEQHLRARRKAKQAGGEAGLGWASGGGGCLVLSSVCTPHHSMGNQLCRNSFPY